MDIRTRIALAMAAPSTAAVVVMIDRCSSAVATGSSVLSDTTLVVSSVGALLSVAGWLFLLRAVARPAETALAATAPMRADAALEHPADAPPVTVAGDALLRDAHLALARRNQNLVARQLDYISELERDETDPVVLEHLFQLDHMATRLRRNAESLLVLAGTESPRQWDEPIPIVDVVRAAAGEVEGYRRVTVGGLEQASVSGSAVADLAHVLAELLENGLSFSPPSTSVEVQGRRSEDGGYVLAVIDHGVGMQPGAVAEANLVLARLGEIGASTTLGLHLVGRIAARHGTRVALLDTPGGGVTARVALPAELLVAPPVVAAPEAVVPAPAPTRPEVAEPAPVAVSDHAPREVMPVAALTPAASLAEFLAPFEAPSLPSASPFEDRSDAAVARTTSGLTRRVRGATPETTFAGIDRGSAAGTADDAAGDAWDFLDGFGGDR